MFPADTLTCVLDLQLLLLDLSQIWSLKRKVEPCSLASGDTLREWGADSDGA